MSPKRRISKRKIGGLAVVAVGLLTVFIWNHRPTRTVIATPPEPTHAVAPVTETPPAPQPVQVEKPVSLAPVPQPAPKPKARSQAQTQAPAVKPPKEPLHDPDARDALALVGLDSNAEQYWLEAIYDTSLPDNEREDLMEDLNETGFNDPNNLTADDLSLVANRLAIIDSVLPNVDDFMAPHLLEARKDLVNMLPIGESALSGQPEATSRAGGIFSNA